MKLFGAFRLDTVNHCLWRGDERASLTPKAFDVLRYLVEHRDRLVTPDELLETLWAETYVNPEGIRKYILEVRKVLADPSTQTVFIKTFPKRGYQFVAPVADDRKIIRVGPADTPSSMVGRQAGLTRLDDCLQRALAGRRQLVFVTGEAGIGKTTLVDVLQQQVSHRGDVTTMRGQCIEGFGGREAYYPMLEALGSLLQGPEGGALVQIFAKQAPTWLIQFPALLNSQQRESLQREILGSTRERMVREICEALEAITAKTPMIVILEDLHWVDASTLDLISAVARRREPARLLVIATYRPVDVVLSQSPLKPLKQDLLLHHLCHEVAIERLEESDVATYLARRYLVESSPPGLSKVIHHNSGGNPLFMAAIVEEMANKGLIAKNREKLILAAPLEEVYPGIPDSLQQMLEIQFEQLRAEEQQILEGCSVLGERFSVWAASVILDTSLGSIEDICERLSQRGQFIRFAGIHRAANGSEAAHYEFGHSLYKQALYHRLSRTHRSKLHRRLGEGLMPICDAGKRELAAELALHFEEGRDYERAIHYLMLAAENAISRFSHRDAIQTLRHALELVPELPATSGIDLEIQTLQRIGDLQYILGEMSDSAASYETAADRAEGAGRTSAHLGVLSRLSFPAWYLDANRGYQISKRALEVSASLDDPLLAARTQLAAASFRLLYDSWRKEDEETCARAHETICSLTGSSVQQDVFYICVQMVQGDYQKALQQADAVIDTTTNPTSFILGHTAKALTLMSLGRFGDVLRLVRSGRELAEKNGEDPWLHIYCEAWLRLLCFDYDGVRRLSELIMRSNAEQHNLRARTIATVASGYQELQRRNYEESRKCFERVRDLTVTPKFFLHWHWRMHAAVGTTEAWLGTGDVANARREADDFLESALSVADPNMRVRAWEIKSRVARAENDFESTRQHIANAFAILDRFAAPMVAMRAQAAAWDLYSSAGEHAKAEEHRRRAKELIMRVADTFEHDEPLRKLLLSAPPVRRILEVATSA
jgi:DNA-binding winged helix-turn-helix (wHTH) protein/tetratricopeptide (TPR) repeat protein